MEQIRPIEVYVEQAREMARRAAARDRDRESHHFTDPRLIAAFQAEHDRAAANAALLTYLKPAMLRQRPAGMTPP